VTDGHNADVAHGARSGWAAALRSHTRTFPAQLWLLVAGTFVYFIGYDLCYPFETVYLHGRLGISMTTVGLILGLSLLAGLPAQILGGAIADRLGRRAVLVLGICASIMLFEGLAFARHLWLVVLVIAIEAGFGWAMFMTANNAMLADLVPLPLRGEAFSVSRVATNGGMVVGPLAGGALLGAGLSYEALFVAGGAVCSLFLLLVLLRMRETRPAATTEQAASLSASAGYRVVVRDRRFLAFCAVALFPLYGFGQFFVTLPVVLRSASGTSPSRWGVLAAVYAGMGVVFQYPMIRKTRDWDKLRLMAGVSAFIGLGLAGAAYAPHGWATAACILFYSVGATLFVPMSAAIVSEMAPLPLRGRYMGAWTAVWLAGLSLGPTFGGLAVDRLGARGAYAIILAVCLAGSAGFAVLQRTQPHRSTNDDPGARVVDARDAADVSTPQESLPGR
jgi:MFS family permease